MVPRFCAGCIRSCRVLAAMRISESVHPRSLNFVNQRKVVIFRDRGQEWKHIAASVVNLQGEHPSADTCQRVYKGFQSKKGRRAFKYGNCGRHATVFTAAVKRFLVKKLRQLRTKVTCTSPVLQAALAKELKVKAELSGIRRVLRSHGYKWCLRKSQRLKYTTQEKQARLAFAESVAHLSAARVRGRLAFSMDGVVLIMPPADLTARANHVHGAEHYIWRKADEANSELLAGRNQYAEQAPANRIINLWGGCSADGFAEVVVSKKRKLNGADWARATDAGKFARALAQVNPTRPDGPWNVLCDNESFLRSPLAREAHRKANITLWKMPPRSPDLNPIEKYWSWLRRALLKKDLEDLRDGKPVPERKAYIARMRVINRSKKAQRVAASIAKGFKKTCKAVVEQGGAAVRD